MCSCQAATGSGSSSRVGGDDGLPEALHVGLAEHGSGPALVGIAEDRPLDEALVLGVEELLDGDPRPRSLGAALVEVGEQLRLGVARDHDRRASCLDHVVDQRDRPGRAPLERVVGCVLDHGALQVGVAIVHVHEAGAALVRDAADRARERQVLRVGRDPEELPGLEVDGDLDRKACVPVEPLVRRHGGKPYSLRIIS